MTSCRCLIHRDVNKDSGFLIHRDVNKDSGFKAKDRTKDFCL